MTETKNLYLLQRCRVFFSFCSLVGIEREVVNFHIPQGVQVLWWDHDSVLG